MKRTFLWFFLLVSIVGLSAQGRTDNRRDDSWAFRPPVEIITLEGLLTQGDYGHIEFIQEDRHYILPGNMERLLEERDLNQPATLEGWEGPVIFTKDGVDYQIFQTLKITLGEEEILFKDGFRGGPCLLGEAWEDRPAEDADRSFRGPGRRRARRFNHCW